MPFADGWDYEGPKKANPRWAKLAETYKLCADTTNQSPIDLRYKKMLAGSESFRPHLDTNVSVFQAKRSKNGSDLPLVSFEQYLVRPPRVVGDAPPVVTWSPPSRGALLTLPGAGQYGLIGFHFHGGSSEHTVSGKSGVAEVHFVFKRIGGPNGISKEAVKAVDEKRGGGESRNVSTATRAAKSRLSAIGRNFLAEVDGSDQKVAAPSAPVTPEAAPAPPSRRWSRTRTRRRSRTLPLSAYSSRRRRAPGTPSSPPSSRPCCPPPATSTSTRSAP
eukprot:TRINITY_DN4061_c0_g1_i2.p1 TRINITY_DN4061_c0_g1~~TRINITY_DN4061_c0_g1_i2.p1  ORF type:complete len:275 (-),score=55.38 TRINITY_DN4061_c0_g1_i2:410-1234(-)